MIAPSPVIPPPWSDRAIPKSMILAWPSLSIMMLPGLRSRWVMPSLWASPRPSAIWRAMARSRPNRQRLRPVDEALQVLAPDVLHRQEESFPLFVEIVHAADVLMPDLAGDLELVAEALGRPLVGGDLGLDELEGDFLVELGVVGPVDLAHPPGAELLDDLVATGEQRPTSKLVSRRLEGFGEGTLARPLRKWCCTLPAELGLSRVLGPAPRTMHPQSPSGRG